MAAKRTSRPTRTGDLSRRRFLGLGTGTAGAVALGGTSAVTFAEPATAQVPGNRFGRMFPGLPAFITPDDRRRAALSDMGRLGGSLDARDNLAAGPVALIADPNLSLNNRDNPTHTAGTTFLGQFLDHDMTFDTTSVLGVPTSPEGTVNNRTPALDLDSVYGGGPAASPNLYQPDRLKLRIESGGLYEDVPRNSNGSAIIADPRNDENAIISGLQAAFILFHNRAVDQLRAQGVPEQQLFAQARRLVTWHYHWIIVNQFLREIIGADLVRDILVNGRRYYRPEPGPAFIPVEFQGAAYRFGHSMVRPSYRLNLAGNPDGTAFFGFIFDPAGQGQADPVDLRGGARARRRFVGWQTFFDFGPSFTDPGSSNPAIRPNKRIDTRISTPLFQLPLGAIATGEPPISLPQRNLLRHVTWSIPAGQRIAQTMGVPMLHMQELASYGVALENQTPLWYYVLAEAERLADGLRLGPVGGRIVGEVFIGLLQLDPNSYLRAQPGWVPTLPTQTPGDFRMTDLLRFARVDPASRGQ
jgi:Animal haem peroxidase